jgi:alpha-ketoglutarate-dependent taurine dioxygenase
MMQVESLNGVATQINNVDITNLSDSDADKIKNILRKDLIVVLKHQERLPYWFVNFVERIGTVANYRQMIYTKEGEFYIGKTPPNTDKWDKDKELYPIQRTTGKKNKKGITTGIFSSGILDWHANLNGLDRADGVALQGYEGCENTSTSYLNTNLAYNDLDDDFKKELEGVHCEYSYTPEVWAKGLNETQYKMMKKDGEDGPYKMWLLQQNIAGVKGIYFYTNNKCKIITQDETLFQRLYDHMFQDKYIYQHWYEPGDIVLMDQLLTLHKRDQNDPEILAERVLHRITFRISNYNNFIQEKNTI